MLCQWKEKMIDLLKKNVNPEFIIVYGSQITGQIHENSDLDIAYYSNQLLSAYEMFLLRGELAEHLQIEVDLVNIKEVDTVFAAQIFSKGEVVHMKDRNVFIRERMKALSMYATLNEQRRTVLQAIEERGTIYGSQ